MREPLHNMCEARDMVGFGVPFDILFGQELLQFLRHSEIVTGIVCRDTKEFLLDVVFFESL